MTRFAVIIDGKRHYPSGESGTTDIATADKEGFTREEAVEFIKKFGGVIEQEITCGARVDTGVAIFGVDVFDLREQAEAIASEGWGWDIGLEDVRKAWNCPHTGGFQLEGSCEDKHYDSAGNIDN